MDKLKTLVAVQLSNTFGLSLFRKGGRDSEAKKKEQRKKFLYGFIFIYICVSFTMYIYNLGSMLTGINKVNAIAPLAVSMSLAAVFFMAMLRAPDTFFACRDFDLLISMPLSTRAVFLSKMMVLYVEMLVYTLAFAIPCAVCCGIFLSPAWWFWPMYFILILFSPALAIAAASLCSFVLTRITAGTRLKNLMGIVLNASLVILVLLVNIKMGSASGSEEAMTAAAQQIARVAYFHPLAGFFERATLNGSILDALVFIAAGVAAIALVAVTVGSAFRTLNVKMHERPRAKEYKGGSEKQTGVFFALLKKESKNYFSQYMFVMNTAIGLILLLFAAVVLAIKGPTLLDSLAGEVQGDMLDYFFLIAMPLITFTCGLAMISASSISLEGASLWILQTAPISVKKIYAAKIMFNVAVCVPVTVISTVIICISVRFSLLQSALLVLLGLTVSAYTSICGLAINLRHPKFDWTSPVVVYKQSAAVMFNMLYVFAPCLITPIVASLVPSVSKILICACLLAALWIVCAAQLLWLEKRGKTRFAELSEM